MRTKISCTIVLLLLSTALFAVDTALFANLGFSEDNNAYMFAQYGIMQGKLFADIFLVDIARNEFYSGSNRSAVYEAYPNAGQNGVSALYTLLLKSRELVEKYHINFLRQGRLIYLAVSVEEDQKQLKFRDFEHSREYFVQLRQSQRGKQESIESEFSIVVRIQDTQNNQDETYVVGRPDYYRNGVSEYSIRQVILSPNEESLIFVIDKIYNAKDGQRIRYMVETVSIQ